MAASICRMVVVSIFVALPLLVADPPNLCPGGDPHSSYVRALQWVLVQNNPSQCNLWFHHETLCLLALYAATWWYAADVVALVRSTSMMRLSPWVPAAFFILALFGIGAADEARLVVWPEHTGIHSTAVPLTCLDVVIALSLLLAIALSNPGSKACSGVSNWICSRLAQLGGYTMAAYATHSYFFCEDATTKIWDLNGFRVGGQTFLPSMTTALVSVEPFGGVAQLLVLLAYPLGYILLFAPVFHYILLGCHWVLEVVCTALVAALHPIFPGFAKPQIPSKSGLN